MDINVEPTISPSASNSATNWIFYLLLAILIIGVIYYAKSSGFITYEPNLNNPIFAKINEMYNGIFNPKELQDAAAGSAVNKLKNKILKPHIKQNEFVLPSDVKPSIGSGENKLQSGFCYIGEDRGFRSCISVGSGDTCMSGDIFPTQAVCINPKLRV
jgi:hypothetical protein